MEKFRRIYAIPDIHGRLDLLDRALELIDQDGYDKKTDRIVFTGDYIDRGPDSKGVVALVKKLVEDDGAVALRGNHEDFAVNHYIKHVGSMDIWIMNGGAATLKSYSPSSHMSDEHIKFLGSLPYSYEANGFFFSHAPVHNSEKPGWYDVHTLTWTYMPSFEEDRVMRAHPGAREMCGDGEKRLVGVCGHIHRGPSAKEIRMFPMYRMLDCGAGCFPTGRLAVHECVSGRTMYAEGKVTNE